uniref:Putative integrase/recombinase HI_1572 n=1 Tax=Candidatus Nitrotoga fabula TaxID=2182327 RepID=A0A2X0QSE2_9PROT|nr:putative integrase/recombinase HI_1572 [Candidatus Nitrotoga fabula]
MATFEKRGQRWRVRIRVDGIDKSETFRTKAEGSAWAAQQEVERSNTKLGRIPDKLFSDLLIRYRDEVSVTKDGNRWERLRIAVLLGESLASGLIRTPDPLAKVRLPDLGPEHFADWRDRRLLNVSPSTVLREWNMLSAMCTRAVREWRWLHENPMRHISRPTAPQPRSRRVSDDEIDRIMYVCGYASDRILDTMQSRVAAAFLFAIETAMRAGEICALKWADIDFGRRVVHVRALEHGARKTGLSRVVPLSRRALELLNQLQGIDGASIFLMEPVMLDALFRKAKRQALIDGLHFHDTRREALTRLAAKVDVMTLAKISGHKDLRILQSVYYAPDMGDVANLLD